eukprot:TRINITY_DN6278_c0_g1_i9.p1 TRINITY_DN6278_c0_g1~~TRINITY_DN6278_c0_g1_i9.p1  ORF type:complete len:156 (+),score=9.16 TRINITY_DN6278_c0_g1_i9:954-1421(+)
MKQNNRIGSAGLGLFEAARRFRVELSQFDPFTVVTELSSRTNMGATMGFCPPLFPPRHQQDTISNELKGTNHTIRDCIGLLNSGDGAVLAGAGLERRERAGGGEGDGGGGGGGGGGDREGSGVLIERRRHLVSLLLSVRIRRMEACPSMAPPYSS